MRSAFIQTLVELAENDSRIILLTGDLGYMAIEPFAQRFPDRFFNVGVAEQNMVGLATGLAEADFIPFVYSIVTFATLRPYEFIRNGPILHRLRVRIVGIGGGVEYGHNGLTHYGLEDISVMRAQPGIKVIAPADYEQARTALIATWDSPGPIYYRIGKDDTQLLPRLRGRFETDGIQCVREGSDLLIVTMGSIAFEAMEAANLLGEDGASVAVVVVADLNPGPIEKLAAKLSQFTNALTVEAHYFVGGLGSLVCEIVAEKGINCRVTRCALDESPGGKTGSQKYVLECRGLLGYQIAREARGFLKQPNE